MARKKRKKNSETIDEETNDKKSQETPTARFQDFKSIDKNDDGFVTKSEFSDFLKQNFSNGDVT